MKRCSLLEHMIKGAGDFVGRSHDGLLGTEPTFEASIKRAESRMRATTDGLGSQAEGLAGSIVRCEGATAQQLAPPRLRIENYY